MGKLMGREIGEFMMNKFGNLSSMKLKLRSRESKNGGWDANSKNPIYKLSFFPSTFT